MKEQFNVYHKATLKMKDSKKSQKPPGSKCLLAVSVGQLYYEATKFRATMKVINDTFNEAAILVGDSLQRYSIEIDNPHMVNNDLITIARLQGTEWMKRNQSAIDACNIPVQIIHWDEWRLHPDFDSYNKQIEMLFHSDPLYKKALDDTVQDYLSRRNQDIDATRVRNLCRKYLMEECAIQLFFPRTQAQVYLYTKGHNLVMRYVYEKLIAPKFPDLLHEASLKLKKKAIIPRSGFAEIREVSEL